jgi:hypothetical protein
MDSRRSPHRVGEAHLADQPTNVQRHRWSAAAPSRFLAPIRSEARAVPSYNSVRPDDRQRIIHLGKQSADTSQYQPVDRDEGRSPGTGSPQHIDLLPQDQNFCLNQCASACGKGHYAGL